MATTVDARTQLAQAVDRARHSRHHPDCRCGAHKGIYCTSMEERWCTMVDRLINQVLN